MTPAAQAAWDAAAAATRHAREHYLTHPVHPPAPQQGPTEQQLARFAWRVLSWHHPLPSGPVEVQMCSCGVAMVLCPYQRLIHDHLGASFLARPVAS